MADAAIEGNFSHCILLQRVHRTICSVCFEEIDEAVAALAVLFLLKAATIMRVCLGGIKHFDFDFHLNSTVLFDCYVSNCSKGGKYFSQYFLSNCGRKLE